MARPATGQVVVDERRRSATYGLRFRAYGRREYVALGTAAEGWTRAKAQTELQNILADVRRGIWRPPTPEPAPEIDRDPTFHEFASQWFESTKGEWREKTRLDYEWQLSSHLLPFFKHHHLSQITITEVDRYRQSTVAEAKAIQVAAAKGAPLADTYTDKRGRARTRARRALAATSINKTITLIEAGEVPLPEGLTPHKLRHTFASILVALGVDPGSVMDQLGHTDPGFTLRVYRHGMRRDPASRQRLRELTGRHNAESLGQNTAYDRSASGSLLTF